MPYKKRKITSQSVSYTNKLHDPPKNMDVNSRLSTSSLKFPVTSRVSPPYLKCIHMVEKQAYSRGVIRSLTNSENMVD